MQNQSRLPCWKRASYLALPACCNIYVMLCAVLSRLASRVGLIKVYKIVLFVLTFNITVNNVSGQSHKLLGINQYCVELMCLASGHNTLPCLGSEPRTS